MSCSRCCHPVLTSFPSYPQAISWLGTTVSWGPRFFSKVLIYRDQYDAMVSVASKDPLFKSNIKGVRRLVRIF
jgi:hypothetical protein